MKPLYVDGKRLNLNALAKKHGLSAGTLHSRIARGWDLEKALKSKPNEVLNKTSISKSDAELALNDLPDHASLPACLRKLIQNKNQKIRYGTKIRNEFRAQFDRWFDLGCLGLPIKPEEPVLHKDHPAV